MKIPDEIIAEARIAFQRAIETTDAAEWFRASGNVFVRWALEEAAKVADETADDCGLMYGDGYPRVECRNVAKRLRKMRDKL